jgi:Spy/CpxP family protein refolding chaperone
MKRLFFRAILALSLAVNVTVGVMALRHRAPASGHMPLLSEVQLDPDQRAKILSLREGFLSFRENRNAQTAQLRVRLADLLKTDTPDRAAIDAVLAQINQSQAALQSRAVEHVLGVRALLRPDQRPAFEKLMTKNLERGIPMRGECEMPDRAQGAQP